MTRFGLALSVTSTLALALALTRPAIADPATRLEDLLAQLRAMPGFSARFEEEKTIALLREPLRSRGALHFLPPNRLLRRVTEPHPSLLQLDDEQLVFTDAAGSEKFDLGANPVARVFAHTFTDILAGDLERLRDTYEMEFRPEGERPWRLDLSPKDAALRGAISGISVRGHGLALIDLDVREASGDSTLTRFSDVDANRRFEASETAELLRPPQPRSSR